jgi:hypothetical protein
LKDIYRRPSPELPHPPEVEEMIARTLNRNASRLRTLTVVPCLILGISAGIMGYFVVRDMQTGWMHGHIPLLSAVVGMVPPFAGAFAVAQWLPGALVRWRRRAWIAALSARHGVPPEVLQDYADLL